MKAATLTLAFVFAMSSLFSQTKKKEPPKTKAPEVPIAQPVINTVQVYNFRLSLEMLNALILALKTTQKLDASSSNTMIDILVTQANDSTLNKKPR